MKVGVASPADEPGGAPQRLAAPPAEAPPESGPPAAAGTLRGLLTAVAGSPLGAMAALLLACSLVMPLGSLSDGTALRWTTFATLFVFTCCGLFATLLVLLHPPEGAAGAVGYALAGLVAAGAPLLLLAGPTAPLLDARGWRAGFWLDVAALACLAVTSLRFVAALGSAPRTGPPAFVRRFDRHAVRAAPLLFGAWVLILWQVLVRALDVPQVLLPAPDAIARSFVAGWGVLAGDFTQTVLHAVLVGLAVGSAAGFATGIAIDRSTFLRRGLLPLAALASTVPLVGIAPIMVMWFGFDWPSKAAVVALMTFFPMLVNTLAGLADTTGVERDLMRSYGAGYGRTLLALRLPVALPFVFGALKIDSTLALIGAIVAEFFGSPTAGLGFRISTEAARLNMGLVWAAILVAALAGSLLYGLIGWVERRVTFWHPSIRTRT